MGIFDSMVGRRDYESLYAGHIHNSAHADDFWNHEDDDVTLMPDLSMKVKSG